MALSIYKHEGKEILINDFTWCKTKADTLTQLSEFADHLRKSPNLILVLSDTTGAYASPEFMKKAHELSPLLKEKIDKHVIMGMTSIKKLLLKGYLRATGDDIIMKDTRDEGLAYLVS